MPVNRRTASRLALEGIRVLDCSHVFALPYCGKLLADFGAEVIKIEGPGSPDPTRLGGPQASFPENEHGEDWWNRSSTYNLLNRGKRSLTLDLGDQRGRDLFRQLVGISDLVLESFTPRVMRGWQLDYPNLKKLRPDIIMVSNTGYGHGQGPYSSYPAQATTMEATHGHCGITGYRDGPPARAGASFVDSLATWTALFAVGAALRFRHLTGQGQWVDIGMHQCGAMLLSENLMEAITKGSGGQRLGNRHPYRAPQGCYPARGRDQWIAISVGDEDQWQALCRLMEREDLSTDPRYVDVSARRQNHGEIDRIISAWTPGYDKHELMQRLQEAGIPAGPVLNGKEFHFDPQVQARGFLETPTYPAEREIGTRPFLGRPYRLSGTSFGRPSPAPTFGQDNADILQKLLGVEGERYEQLGEDAVIATVPTSGEAPPLMTPEEALSLGQLAEWDPDYRQRLGI